MLLSTWPRSLRTCSSASLRAMASRWTPSGTSPLSFVFPCTTNTATRCISDRHEFENELHLGRACSSFDIDPATKKKWKKELGQLPKLKLKVPEELLYPQAEYEIRALAEIHERSYDCNILLEVRDVRVPASSHHPSFTRLADHRLHLICYTHADMIDQETRDRVEKWTLKFWKDARCIFLDTRETRANFSARKKVKVWDEDEEDEGEGPKRVTSPYEMVYDSLLKHIEERGGINTALTVGVANTGKSSLLMALLKTARLRGDLTKALKGVTQKAGVSKKGKKMKKKVGKLKGGVAIEDKPGKTREITEYLLREKPRAFFLDVPGVTPPHFFYRERPEAWFAFGAANLIQLGKVAEKDWELNLAFCQYVLYCMNRDANFGYVKKLFLNKPTQDIEVVLNACKRPKSDGSVPESLRLAQCRTFLKLFNTGNFGPVILDDLSKPYERFIFKDAHFQKRNWKMTKKRFEDGEVEEQVPTDEYISDDDEDSFYKV